MRTIHLGRLVMPDDPRGLAHRFTVIRNEIGHGMKLLIEALARPHQDHT